MRPQYEVVASSDEGKHAKKARDQAVSHFMENPSIMALFMDSGGAVGFDLSCVRRIICLEPVHEPDGDLLNLIINQDESISVD